MPRRIRCLGLALASLLAADRARAQEALVDPTAPPLLGAQEVAPAQPARPLQLQSVLISGDRRVAVIDGLRVQIGDRVAGFEVAGIEPTGVRLEGAAGALRLPLRRAQVKEPAQPGEGSE